MKIFYINFIIYFNNICFELDEYIIMPDHVHMIIVIKNKIRPNFFIVFCLCYFVSKRNRF